MCWFNLLSKQSCVLAPSTDEIEKNWAVSKFRCICLLAMLSLNIPMGVSLNYCTRNLMSLLYVPVDKGDRKSVVNFQRGLVL